MAVGLLALILNHLCISFYDKYHEQDVMHMAKNRKILANYLKKGKLCYNFGEEKVVKRMVLIVYDAQQ